MPGVSGVIVNLGLAAILCACEEKMPPAVVVLQPTSSQTGFLDSTSARLCYRLDLPERTARVPAAVIGHGSGQVTKDAPRTVAILDALTARGKRFARVVFPGADHDLSGAPIWTEIDRGPARNTPGTIALTLLGNAAIHLTDGQLTLVTDFPYRSGAFGYMTYSRDQAQAFRNVVTLITHRHDDHVEIETLKRLQWRVIGPPDVTRQLPASSVVAASAASTIDPELRVQAIETPHAKVDHFSYLVEWHGRRFYFSGDTEDPSSALAQKSLDIAFVSPWIYQAVRSGSSRIDAARVVIYHHTTDERVPACTTPCEVPAQGAQWSVSVR